jgi:hypothetical protein
MMADHSNAFARVFASCWKDDAFKARFMNDPRAVLADHGVDLPEAIDIKIVENADNTVHITIPSPPANHHELSNEELSEAAGGVVGVGGFGGEGGTAGSVD